MGYQKNFPTMSQSLRDLQPSNIFFFNKPKLKCKGYASACGTLAFNFLRPVAKGL
jgi:hypothetical protein